MPKRILNDLRAPDFDQRGVERPQLSWCDSGAVEYLPEPSLALLQVSTLLVVAALKRRARLKV